MTWLAVSPAYIDKSTGAFFEKYTPFREVHPLKALPATLVTDGSDIFVNATQDINVSAPTDVTDGNETVFNLEHPLKAPLQNAPPLTSVTLGKDIDVNAVHALNAPSSMILMFDPPETDVIALARKTAASIVVTGKPSNISGIVTDAPPVVKL